MVGGAIVLKFKAHPGDDGGRCGLVQPESPRPDRCDPGGRPRAARRLIDFICYSPDALSIAGLIALWPALSRRLRLFGFRLVGAAFIAPTSMTSPA